MIATVIVTHNSAAYVAECVRAVRPYSAEVVVVDNASADGSADAARQAGAVVIANHENRGFAAAVNQGAAATQSGLILVLNPDAIVQTPLAPLEDACARKGIGAAAGLLRDRDGEPQSGFTVRRLPTPSSLAFEILGLNRLWPGNPVNRRYRCVDLDLSKAQEVEQPAGAFLMIRRDVWVQLGGFDERFHPVWFEDVDLLARLRKSGFTVWFEPKVIATHRGGHSVGQLPPGPRVRHWYGNLLKYAALHFGPAGFRVTVAACAIGCAVRWLITGIAEYRAVLMLAGAQFFVVPEEIGSGKRKRES